MRRRGEQQIVRCLLAKEFAQPIPLALVLRIARGHAVRFVHDYQIPVLRLTDARQDFLALRQVHRGDELRLFVPHVHAVLDAKIGATQDVKRFLEAVGHFALPLEGKVRGADNEHALDQPAQFEFLDEQPGHNGLARTRVVREEETTASGLQQVVVNGVELVWQRVNARDGQPKERIVFLRQ